jgi:hypothetical protein
VPRDSSIIAGRRLACLWPAWLPHRGHVAGTSAAWEPVNRFAVPRVRVAGEWDADFPPCQRGQALELATKKACRVNWPSPKPRREIGLRRAIWGNVPLSNPQACAANDCGSWAFSRSRKGRRKFGWEPTGAGEGIRTLGPNLGGRWSLVCGWIPVTSARRLDCRCQRHREIENQVQDLRGAPLGLAERHSISSTRACARQSHVYAGVSAARPMALGVCTSASRVNILSGSG